MARSSFCAFGRYFVFFGAEGIPAVTAVKHTREGYGGRREEGKRGREERER